MAKKAKVLSPAEVFYITEKAKSGLTKEEIAENLALTVDQVEVHFPQKIPRQETLLQKNMKRRTEKGRKVSVMTPNASQVIDETRTKVLIHGKNVDCIHRPLGDE